MEGGNDDMHDILYSLAPVSAHDLEVQEEQRPDEPQSPTHVLSPVSSVDSEELLDSYLEQNPQSQLDPSQEEQIEELKEFLSETQAQNEHYATQSNAPNVKALEGMHIGSTTDGGLGAQHELAPRNNLHIEKLTVAGGGPLESTYYPGNSSQEVLDENHAIGAGYRPISTSPAVPATSPMRSPRNVDSDKALKNEIDCLFQERAAKFWLE